MGMGNEHLRRAQRYKYDEFYTYYDNIAAEIPHYAEHFKGKSVYCNCDDYRISNFVKYFKDNFENLKLKKLTATNKDIGAGAWRYEYDGKTEKVTPMSGDGDFRLWESLKILKESDVICTNPPFSLFREYIAQLFEYEKKFLIIGNINAVKYCVMFPHVKNNEIFTGKSRIRHFRKTDGREKKMGNAVWWQNLSNFNENNPLTLTAEYTPEKYTEYDNCEAVNIDKTKEIPCDYHGVMGVPVSYIEKHCSKQFEIVGHLDPWLNGVKKFRRILIKRK